jgi:hypothetical protein
MQDQPQYQGIVERLKSLQARIAQLSSGRGLIKTIGLALLIFGLLIVVTIISWLSISVRIIIDIATLALLGVAIYFWVIRPYLRRPGFVEIARLLEKKYGKFQSRLIAALELHDLAAKNRENYSIELIEKTIEEAGGVIAEIDTDAIIDHKPFNQALIRAGILLFVTIAALLINPTAIYNTILLYSQPLTSFEKPPEFALTINPDGGEFYRNLDLPVKAEFSGKAPRKVDLYYKFEDGSWASESMARPESTSEASFVYTFKKIKRSVDIYAKSGHIQTAKAHIDIVDPPRITDLNLSFDYPDYSGLQDARGNPNDGNIAALRGTKVNIEAKANKPLAECYQMFADSSRVPLNVDGDMIRGNFTVKDNSRYTLMIRDNDSHINPEPIWYDIQTLEDYPPTITIKFPATDVDLDEHMVLPLEAGISDDFGFGKMNLVYWVMSDDQQTQPTKINIDISDKKNLDQDVKYTWDMQSLNLLPGDLIYYYCEISDNDIISGPKWTKSKTFSARLPNLDEILADVKDSQDNQMETLEQAMKSQQELQKQVDDLSKDMMKSNNVNWEKQKEAKDILQKQQDVAKKLENLAQEMQKNLDKLEDNKMISEQIADKMQELQQLMEEVAPPEFKDAMKKLQDALQKMDPNELKKALDQFKMTADQMLENLDRAIALMQKLAVEQKMDMLVQMAQKLQQEQDTINKNVDAASDSSKLASQTPSEKNTSDEFDLMKNEFKDLQEMDKTQQMIPDKEENAAAENVNNPQIPENFKDLKSGLCSGNGGNCKNKGKKLHQDLSETAQALEEAQKAMQQKEKAELAKKMQKAAEDLLYLSNRQEDLLDSTKTYQYTGDGLRQMASSEMQIAGASSRVAEVISDLSKESIFVNITLMKLLGSSLSDMADATDRLDKRFAPGAIQSQQSAMGNLNKTVFLLLQAKDNAMKSSSGSGLQEMMQQMKKMSEMQAGINDQTLMSMPQPGMQMNMGQQQALKQLAAQQEMLRQKLQEMNDQFGKRGDMLGRLDQLGDEMKKVVDEMKSNKVNSETIHRQEQILSRMLDAQKSVNKRDFTKKRLSEQGNDIVRKSPTLPDDHSGDTGWLSEMIKKALEEQYPRQYEKLIRAYFKSFQNQGAPLEK